jgi:hypothetical protein
MKKRKINSKKKRHGRAPGVQTGARRCQSRPIKRRARRGPVHIYLYINSKIRRFLLVKTKKKNQKKNHKVGVWGDMGRVRRLIFVSIDSRWDGGSNGG